MMAPERLRTESRVADPTGCTWLVREGDVSPSLQRSRLRYPPFGKQRDRRAHATINGEMTEIIKHVVQDITGAEQIVLFGSRARGDSRPDSDYDILAVVSHSLEPRERLRLSSSCRLHLARMGIDADVLVKSPDEIRDYRDKRGSIVYEALGSGIPL